MFPLTRYITTICVAPEVDLLSNTYSVLFDGSNDYLSVKDTNDFSFGDGSNDSAFTVSVWAKIVAIADKYLITKGTGSTREWLFTFYANEKISVDFRDESAGVWSARTSDSGVVSTQGNWTHYAFTYDGTGGSSASDGVTIYINGSAIASTASNNAGYVAMENTAQGLEFCKYNTAYMNANLDEVSIWNKELSATEITAIYDNNRLDLSQDSRGYSSSSNLKGWWRMGDGTSDEYPLIADQTNTTLGSNLFDSDASLLRVGGTYNGTNPSEHATDTYGWSPVGDNNLLANDSGEIKITYADNSSGAQFYFRNASDLSAEMDAHSIYKFTFDARYTGGSSGVKGKVYDSVGYNFSDAFTTSTANYTIYFPTFASPASNFFSLDSMDTSNIVHIDNLSVKKVNGNPGFMNKMTASDIEEDVPS